MFFSFLDSRNCSFATPSERVGRGDGAARLGSYKLAPKLYWPGAT